MDFNFGKNILDKKNIITQDENKDLDDKLDNIYESIQNIVFILIKIIFNFQKIKIISNL